MLTKMADESTMRRLWRYKADLEQGPDEEKLLELLGKLKKLRVSIAALQETGIGKLVNRYKKKEGLVGETAAFVVNSWKSLVKEEVKQQDVSADRSPSPQGNESSGEEDRAKSDEESDTNSWNSFQEDEIRGRSSVTDHRKRLEPTSNKRHMKESQRHRKYPSDTGGGEKSKRSQNTRDRRQGSQAYHLSKVKSELEEEYTPSKVQKQKYREESPDSDGPSERYIPTKKRKCSPENHNMSRSRDSPQYESYKPTPKNKYVSENCQKWNQKGSEETGDQSELPQYIPSSKRNSVPEGAASEPEYIPSKRQISKGARETSDNTLDFSDQDVTRTSLGGDEDLTDSDKEYTESSTGMPNIEEYYKTMLAQSSSDIKSETHSREKNKSHEKKNDVIDGCQLKQSSQRKDKRGGSSSMKKDTSKERDKHKSRDKDSAHIHSHKSHHSSHSENRRNNSGKDRTGSSQSKEKHSSSSKSSKSSHSKERSHGDHHPVRSSAVKESEVRKKESSSYHRVNERGDGRRENKKVDRKRQYHSMSESEEENDSLNDNDKNKSEMKYSSSSTFHKSSASSSRDSTRKPSKSYTSSNQERKSSSSPSHSSPSTKPKGHSKTSPERGHQSSSHSHSSSRHHSIHSSRESSVTVKMEDTANDNRYGRETSAPSTDHFGEESSSISLQKYMQRNQDTELKVEIAKEYEPQADEELYSPAWPSIKKEKVWESDNGHPEYSPTPVKKVKEERYSPQPINKTTVQEARYSPTPVEKYKSGIERYSPTPIKSSRNNDLSSAKIKEERYSPICSSETAIEEDERYSPAPISDNIRIKQEVYSPTPKPGRDVDKEKKNSKQKAKTSSGKHSCRDDSISPHSHQGDRSRSSSASRDKHSSSSSVKQRHSGSEQRSHDHSSSHKHSKSSSKQKSHSSSSGSQRTSHHSDSSHKHEHHSTTDHKSHSQERTKNVPSSKDKTQSIYSKSSPVSVKNKHLTDPSSPYSPSGTPSPSSEVFTHKHSVASEKTSRTSSVKPEESKVLISSKHAKVLCSPSGHQHCSSKKTGKKSSKSPSPSPNHRSEISGKYKGKSSEKTSSSSRKKAKTVRHTEDQGLDLFSDAIHIKTEPTSPVRKASKSDSRKATEKSRPSSSSSSHQSSPSHKSSTSVTPVNHHKTKSSKNTTAEESYAEHEQLDISETPSPPNKRKDKNKSKKNHAEELPQNEEGMTFEDFMTFDEAILVKKGKSALKSSSKSSTGSGLLSHSTQSHQQKQSKPRSSKNYTSSLELPSSSKSLSVPAPAKDIKVTEKDILSLLPETQAHYRPLRFNPYFKDEKEESPSPPPPLVDPDLIGTKTGSRTQVYSGRRHGVTEVKSLHDLCMQILIDNVDAIDYVGGIPYSILKPVLERCTAQQLYQLEDYNPHFLEDTDELWENLSQREFRGSTPEELESWREMFMRKYEEREAKYQKLKQSFSSSVARGQMGRKAQLAYVDTVAKPPREVLRKQKQFGTGSIMRTKGNPNITGSASGLKAYRPSTRVAAHNPIEDKPRIVRPMPPMMAKSLQMRKNMRR